MVAGTCLHLCSRKMSTQVAVPVSKQTLIKGDTDDMVTLTDVAFIVLPSYAVIAMSPLGIPALMNVYQISVRGIKTN